MPDKIHQRRVALRPALNQELEYCRRLYFSETEWIIEELRLDRTAQEIAFQQQWNPAQVDIILLDEAPVGWLQTIARDDELFVAQIFVECPFQRWGIGTEVMKRVIGEAARSNQTVRLNVVKINPARLLYERLGFRITGEDDRKVNMKLLPHVDALPCHVDAPPCQIDSTQDD